MIVICDFYFILFDLNVIFVETLINLLGTENTVRYSKIRLFE